MDEFFKITLGLDVPTSDADVDISGMLENLKHAAIMESLSGQPVQKTYQPSPAYVPTNTLTPAAGSPLAKSYAEFVQRPAQTPARIERVAVEGHDGAEWVKHFDAAGNMFHMYLDERDEPQPAAPTKTRASEVQYADVPDFAKRFLEIEG